MHADAERGRQVDAGPAVCRDQADRDGASVAQGREIMGVADPAIWDASRGESVAQTAARYGVYFTPGDNERIAGWMQCHYRLQFDENGYPRMYVFKIAGRLSGRCR